MVWGLTECKHYALYHYPSSHSRIQKTLKYFINHVIDVSFPSSGLIENTLASLNDSIDRSLDEVHIIISQVQSANESSNISNKMKKKIKNKKQFFWFKIDKFMKLPLLFV